MTCILVIEDEDLIRESLEDLLLAEGFDVITAENGHRGVQVAIQERPHLIICDVMMPILNGYEVLAKLRENRNLRTVPFLFLTSISDRRSNRKGMSLGADDYLEKPCTKDELLEAIAVRLDRQRLVEQCIAEKMDALRNSITLALPHELQTPLSGIIGLSELMMMQSEELSHTEIYEYAHGIHCSAERLHRLIQNYLLYSKLLVLRSQEQIDFTSPYYSPSNLIITEIVERKARECDRLEDLELQAELIDLKMSPDDLFKIVEELVDNAFKYSLKGSKVSVISRIDSQQWILEIHDQGRGMSEKQIQAIGAYMQFDRQLHEQQGLGLGMSISKILVELYGGDLQINSQLEQGTDLQVSIPLS